MTLPPLINGVPAPWGDLVSMLDGVVRSSAREAGVTIDGVFMSYGDLRDRSQSIAAHFLNAGLQRGDHVCSLMQNRVEVLLTWFGTMIAGGIWVPLNIGLQGEDLRHILRDADPRFLVADAEGADKISECTDDTATNIRQQFIVGPAETNVSFSSFTDLLVPCGEAPRFQFAPSDPAVIIYTGGTTGLPKGVVLPHFSMVCGGLRYRDVYAATSQDRHFSVSPLFHAGGLTIAVLGPMMAGMSTIVDRTFSVSSYWQRVRETRATLINPIGVILTLLCRQPVSEQDQQHSVRASLGVTGQLPDGIPAEFSKRFGIEIVNIYSLSEASGALIITNELNSPKPEANGKGRHWAEVGIIDKAGNLLAPGEVGEIVLRPKIPYTFMLGYHRNPERTLDAFANLWLHTGDIGYVDEDGFLYFQGREAHWLRRRGENVSCYEVEAIISQHPEVEEVAIVGVPSEIGEEDVKAFVVKKAGIAPQPEAFILWCVERMASFKVPRYIELIDALPRSAAKREVERHVLKARSNDRAWDREKVFGRKLPARKGSG